MCSQTDDLLAVSWTVDNHVARGVRAEASIIAVEIGGTSELVVSMTLQGASVEPVVKVSVDGTVIATLSMLRVPVVAGYSCVFRAEVALPMQVADGRGHHVRLVASPRADAGETQPLRALTGSIPPPTAIAEHHIEFYAKRHSRRVR